MKVEVGNKVYVPCDDATYTAMARDDRYIICTRPYEDTVMYFIVDLVNQWRAPDNMVFCSGYETEEDCKERLLELQRGDIELSRRNGLRLDLDIT